jgi:hypothetical protein
MKNFNDFNDSIALNYFKELYNDGGMSGDVYEDILMDSKDSILSLDKNGNKNEIEKSVLDFLQDIGVISGDVYDTEMEFLNR